MRMEKLIQTVEYFGPSVLQNRVVLLGHNYAFSVKDVKVDLSAISDYDSDYLRK